MKAIITLLLMIYSSLSISQSIYSDPLEDILLERESLFEKTSNRYYSDKYVSRKGMSDSLRWINARKDAFLAIDQYSNVMLLLMSEIRESGYSKLPSNIQIDSACRANKIERVKEYDQFMEYRLKKIKSSNSRIKD